MEEVKQYYRKTKPDFEICFNIGASEPLTAEELKTLQWLLAETFEPQNFAEKSLLDSGKNIVEIGPRLSFETADSSNAVSICHSCGLHKITRLECSRRYRLPENSDREDFIVKNHDRMTEQVYAKPLQTFLTGGEPEKTFAVPLMSKGIEEMARFNREKGLGMDQWDMEFYVDLFTKVLKRDPTNVELFMLGNNNSEHARHWFFKGKLVIDGKPVPHSLLQLIKAPLAAHKSNSVIAFSDNSSAIKGYRITTIMPQQPGASSPFIAKEAIYHIIFTAETHNYPSGIQPFQGATTGTGGRIRDVQATGRGGLVVAGTAGYCTAALNIPDFKIPGEPAGLEYPYELAPAREILIQASNGASDYGNKFGEPIIQGFVRTFEQVLPDKERRAWLKPIMFTGGVGQMDDRHLGKKDPGKGMLIVQVGGAAYRIGIGGGSASSMIQGENIAELDFNAVQRGNAEMENKLNRVFRTCVEMCENNPFLTVHDQGAGGPGNVLAEIINPAGGIIKIRNIKLGDPTLSVVEILCSEYQERGAFLVKQDRIEELQAICLREKVNCEVLGEITGDGKMVVYDDNDNSRAVDLPLDRTLGEMPQKTFDIKRIPKKLEPLKIPDNLTVKEALEMVFRLPTVGSKGYLVRKVDRSVTGLIAQQQCCGPLQLPVADVAVIAQSHFGLTGAAISIGEQPIKMLINEKAGGRMSVGEMLTNMAGVRISDLGHIKCSVNWMWAAKLPGEGARIYDAAVAVSEIMTSLGIAPDGGKDSLSMAARVSGENVKAPGDVVISSYATVPDIRRKVTPDIKWPGESRLILLDLGKRKNRMGGSALAQALGQLGDESPDVDSVQLLKDTFNAVQGLLDAGMILACHDRSDGGLITTLAEMIMSGNCGMSIDLPENTDAITFLFSEELGLVVEYLPVNENIWLTELALEGLSPIILGKTEKERKAVIRRGGKFELDIDTATLLAWWESSSDRLEEDQMNPAAAKEQAENHIRPGLKYHLSFEPAGTPENKLQKKDKHKVAIIREEGSNGDREMTSAFYWAGFEPWDVTMTDLLEDRVSLDKFRGVVFVGGFSYADVLDAAKGWASAIRFNAKLKDKFYEFFNRPDTFSLGICNGCQLMALLGILPWQGIPEVEQPRFIRNRSQRFESHWGTVKITDSPAVMLKGMAGSILGIWSAHGEGRLHCANPQILNDAIAQKLTPCAYVDDEGQPTEKYRFSPNGSPMGINAICSKDGRHLAMMPHPERSFLLWQWPYVPEAWKAGNFKYRRGERFQYISPWLKMFQNAREWCDGE